MSNDWVNLMVLGWHLHIGPWYARIGYNGYHKANGWPCGRIAWL
jgi:hypothetical protein